MTAVDELLNLLPRGDDTHADDIAAERVAQWWQRSCCSADIEGIAFGCERLLDAAAGPRRYLAATSQVAALFDVTEREATAMLFALDDDTDEWMDSGDGIRIRFTAGGPGLGTAIATFLELSPGARFPLHEHHADETSVLVQGACRESVGLTDESLKRGATYGAGDILVRSAGDLHSFVALGGRPTVFAIKSGGLSFVL